MPDDKETLKQLNIRIGAEEDKGDDASRQWFATVLLAPRFAFVRADGKTFDDWGAFLAKVAPSGPRETAIENEDIDLHGDRAVVKCVVTMGGRKYHNIRLFVRLGDAWKLLGWANEEVP